jgi:hypothetical protein
MIPILMAHPLIWLYLVCLAALILITVLLPRRGAARQRTRAPHRPAAKGGPAR